MNFSLSDREVGDCVADGQGYLLGLCNSGQQTANHAQTKPQKALAQQGTDLTHGAPALITAS